MDSQRAVLITIASTRYIHGRRQDWVTPWARSWPPFWRSGPLPPGFSRRPRVGTWHLYADCSRAEGICIKSKVLFLSCVGYKSFPILIELKLDKYIVTARLLKVIVSITTTNVFPTHSERSGASAPTPTAPTSWLTAPRESSTWTRSRTLLSPASSGPQRR